MSGRWVLKNLGLRPAFWGEGEGAYDGVHGEAGEGAVGGGDVEGLVEALVEDLVEQRDGVVVAGLLPLEVGGDLAQLAGPLLDADALVLAEALVARVDLGHQRHELLVHLLAQSLLAGADRLRLLHISNFK